MNFGSKFEVGDLVWAKMKCFSPWPAKIVEPQRDIKRPVLKKPMQCVFFFGSENYAWIVEELIWPYEENKEEHMKKNKSAPFKEAIQAIEDYIQKNPRPPKPISPSSSEDDIAVIFPSSSNKTGHIRDYSRTPFLSKMKPGYSPVKKGIKRVLHSNIKVKRTKTSATFKPSALFGDAGVSSSDSFSPVTSTLKRPPIRLPYHMNSSSKTSALMKPPHLPRSVTPPPVIEKVCDVQRPLNVNPSNLKFGFLGLGIMGRGILKNLLNSGHYVTVWNRTPSKCEDFVAAGAMRGKSPADVVTSSDITFCCVSNPQAAKEVVFGISGVLQSIGSNKGYVEMTSIDSETSQDLAEAIISRGGRYLEAPVCGSKRPAENGTLIILAAGDRSLFNDCGTCFQAMGKHAFYLGDVGSGCKMNIVINMILGTMLAGLAEAMALADRTGLSQKDMVEVLELGSLGAPAIVEKGKAIIEGTFPTQMPLQHMQKDLHLALGMGDQMDQPLPLIAAANEVYKHAKRLSYGEHDVSAVYLRARF